MTPEGEIDALSICIFEIFSPTFNFGVSDFRLCFRLESSVWRNESRKFLVTSQLKKNNIMHSEYCSCYVKTDRSQSVLLTHSLRLLMEDKCDHQIRFLNLSMSLQKEKAQNYEK